MTGRVAIRDLLLLLQRSCPEEGGSGEERRGTVHGQRRWDNTPIDLLTTPLRSAYHSSVRTQEPLHLRPSLLWAPRMFPILVQPSANCISPRFEKSWRLHIDGFEWPLGTIRRGCLVSELAALRGRLRPNLRYSGAELTVLMWTGYLNLVIADLQIRCAPAD